MFIILRKVLDSRVNALGMFWPTIDIVSKKIPEPFIISCISTKNYFIFKIDQILFNFKFCFCIFNTKFKPKIFYVLQINKKIKSEKSPTFVL